MKNKLDRIAKDTNFFLNKFIKRQNNSKLIPAMRYGLFPGGKKIRSKILVDIGSLLSIDYRNINFYWGCRRMYSCLFSYS
jgi:farnesyl diphosphate synthase